MSGDETVAAISCSSMPKSLQRCATSYPSLRTCPDPATARCAPAPTACLLGVRAPLRSGFPHPLPQPHVGAGPLPACLIGSEYTVPFGRVDHPFETWLRTYRPLYGRSATRSVFEAHCGRARELIAAGARPLPRSTRCYPAAGLTLQDSGRRGAAWENSTRRTGSPTSSSTEPDIAARTLWSTPPAARASSFEGRSIAARRRTSAASRSVRCR